MKEGESQIGEVSHDNSSIRTNDGSSQQQQQHANDASPSSIRSSVGSSMHTVSDWINHHLIAVRYATASSVLLLGMYSLSQTPLFFRFKTAQSVPATYFTKRKVLTCRLLGVVEEKLAVDEAATAPIVCLVRHLSPMARFLTKNQFDWVVKHSPSSSSVRTLATSATSKDLIRVQLDQVHQSALYYSSEEHGDTPLLQTMARNKRVVYCQLMAFQDKNDGIAIARMYYWQPHPILFWFLPQHIDVGSHLMETGQARLPSDDYDGQHHRLHGSGDIKDHARDVKYVERLEGLETRAIAERQGMWNQAQVRASAKDVVEQIEWETTASWYQKLWRRVRGG